MSAKRKKQCPLRSPGLSNLKPLNFISSNVARAYLHEFLLWALSWLYSSDVAQKCDAALACLYELSLEASSWLYSSNVAEKSSLRIIEVVEIARACFVTTPNWYMYRSLVVAFYQRFPSAQNGVEFGRGLSIFQGPLEPGGQGFWGRCMGLRYIYTKKEQCAKF